MPRYVAFLRGVSPMNARMSELKRCFERAGFADVKSVLSSGNIAFSARAAAEAALERKAERAMARHLRSKRAFYTIVRASSALRALLEEDPYAKFALPANAKRIVTFLREPSGRKIALPIEADGVRILAARDREILTVYTPSARGAVFMVLIERTFGKNVTTRTWDTVRKCASA